MSQGKPVPRVKSGPPLWVWILLVFATLVVLTGTAVTLVPDDPAELYELAQQNLTDQDSEEFDINLNKLKDFPAYEAHVNFLEGLRSARERREIKAMEYYQAALSSEELKPEVLKAIGTSQTNTGKFTDAIDTYRQAIELSDDAQADQATVSLAALYYSVGAYTLAESTLNEALEQNEQNKPARTMRATIRTDTGRCREAIEDFKLLLATPGDRAAANPALLGNYGECLLDVGTDEEITAFLKDCHDLITNDYLSLRLVLRAGELDTARILQQNGDFALPPGGSEKIVAMIRLKEGNLKDAATAIMFALTANPRDRDAFETARQIFEKNGDSAKLDVVEDNLKRFKELDQEFLDVVGECGDDVTDFESRLKAGNLKREVGDFTSAQRWYTMATMLAPSRSGEAAEARNQMGQPLSFFVEFPRSEKQGSDSKPDAENADPTTDNSTSTSAPPKPSEDGKKRPTEANQSSETESTAPEQKAETSADPDPKPPVEGAKADEPSGKSP